MEQTTEVRPSCYCWKQDLRQKQRKGKTNNFVESEKDRKHKIRWDKTTGGSQWAEDKKQLDETPTWKELAEAVATIAEEICGRKPRSSDIPCLESMKLEYSVFENLLRTAVPRFRKPEVIQMSPKKEKGTKVAEKEQGSLERRQKHMLVRDVCCELEWSIQNKDKGRMYKNFRKLCKRLVKTTLKGVEDISAEPARSHFLKIGGEPARQFNHEVLEHVQQREIREELGAVPEDEEIEEAMKNMKERAAGVDEVTISMLTNGGESTRSRVCAIVKKLWKQASKAKKGRSKHMRRPY